MRIDFHRSLSDGETEVEILASAVWDGRRAVVEASSDEIREAMAKVFRPTPLVVDDPAYRQQGTEGPVGLQPGTVEWFRAAAQVRAEEVGLVARVVSERREGGWDPAAQYRTFAESMRRYT